MSSIDIQPDDQAVFDRMKSTGKITHQLRRMVTQQWNVCVSCNSKIPENAQLLQVMTIKIDLCSWEHVAQKI